MTEGGERRSDHRVHLLTRLDITSDRARASAAPSDLAGNRFTFGKSSACHHDSRSLSCQGQRDTSPNFLSSAGHNRNLSVESRHGNPLHSSVVRAMVSTKPHLSAVSAPMVCPVSASAAVR